MSRLSPLKIDDLNPEQRQVDDTTYSQGVELWGESGMIELVTVIGYYCIVSLTLNTFKIPVSESMQDPFAELP